MKSEIKLLKEYQEYRMNGKGDDPKTVEKKLHAIHMFRKFINKPFHKFNKDDATEFKNYLVYTRKLGLRTVYSYLYYLEQFFYWLSCEKGYRSKIVRNHIEFFSLNRSEKAIVNSSSPILFPDIDYILKFHNSIPVDTEIGMRDRALVAIAYCSGMRAETLTTLKLGSIDENYFVYQDPEKDVKTKFSKKNVTLIFDYHPSLKKSIEEWIRFLKKKGFVETDPLFPKFAPLAGTNQNFLFEDYNEPSKEFISNPNTLNQIFRRRCKIAGIEYKHPHLFRHAFFDTGREYCTNSKQFKALSQSGSHSNIETTMKIYGELTIEELKKQLLKINANIINSKKSNPEDDEFIKMLDELKEKVKSRKRKKRF